MYGAKFTDLWAGVAVETMIATWSSGLSGFTPEEIRRGLTACMERPWPPTLPEFATLCRPALDPQVTFTEALTKMRQRCDGYHPTWSHPAVYWAAATIGYSELRSQPTAVMLPRWKAVLHDMLERGKWDAVPPPPVSYIAESAEHAEEARERNRAAGREAFARIKAHLAAARAAAEEPSTDKEPT